MSVPESSPRSAPRPMPEPAFAELEQRLLQGGIARRYVERTLLELREHYTDVEQDALASGVSRAEAAERARAALGDEHILADAVLAHPELRDWRRDWPRTAACIDSITLIAVLPVAPVAYCAYRGTSIARWSVSASLATLMTAALLLALRTIVTL